MQSIGPSHFNPRETEAVLSQQAEGYRKARLQELISALEPYRNTELTILYGGVGGERPFSLRAGPLIGEALSSYFKVVGVKINDTVLPPDLCRGSGVVYPALYDALGEDGGLQSLLEARGIIYAGSDSRSSRLCLDKPAAKQCVAAAGMRVVPGFAFEAKDAAAAMAAHLKRFQGPFVLKPANGGSSLGLRHGLSREQLEALLPLPSKGRWMIETQIYGREITVGVLEGKALGLVEIMPKGAGIYDYKHKFTKGLTDFRFPAVVTPELEAEIKQNAECVFAACGCRDYARVDYRISDAGECYFLEINNAPGMGRTGLLAKSAFCCDLDYTALCLSLIKPALKHFHQTFHSSVEANEGHYQ